VRTPENVVRRAAELHAREDDWRMEHGREPTDEDMADFTGMSVKRIKDLRRKSRAFMSESQLPADEQGNVSTPAVSAPSSVASAAEMLHKSLTDVERRVFEWKTGYGGARPMSNAEIARRLKMSPSAVSQMGKTLAHRLERLSSDAGL
jgi:DNA-directed RNA polymerase specialized sigma subunit